jgi:hypothetical protein
MVTSDYSILYADKELCWMMSLVKLSIGIIALHGGLTSIIVVLLVIK